jgi:hypothetical protein
MIRSFFLSQLPWGLEKYAPTHASAPCVTVSIAETTQTQNGCEHASEECRLVSRQTPSYGYNSRFVNLEAHSMTDEEKQIFKAMNNFVFNAIFELSVYKAVVSQSVPDWTSKMEFLSSSAAFQTIRQECENTRQSIELLLDENKLTALQSAIANICPTN